MKKLLLGTAIVASLGAVSTSANAALAADALLGIDGGVGACPVGGTFPNCNYGLTNVIAGSYFAMDTDANGFDNKERVVMNTGGTDGGITLTGAQTGHGVDGPTEGSTDASGNIIGTVLTPGQINGGWDFFGAHGWDTTTAAPTITSDDGAGNVTLGMAGWLVHWNGGDIDMGQGADAVMTCVVDCGFGDTYALDYTAIVPSGSFTGVAYQLHLEGTIGTSPVSAVPVPAAAWLFGSGLLGLVGVARRRKAA